jgi:hypothetical protein
METTTRPAAEQTRERMLATAMSVLDSNLETLPLGTCYVFNGIKGLANETIAAMNADPESKLVIQAVKLRQKIDESSIDLSTDTKKVHAEAKVVSDAVFSHLTAKNDTRYLFIQELLVMSLTDSVPATTLYDYWANFKPVSEEGLEYHASVIDKLEVLEPKAWQFEKHADANLSFWETITNSIDKVSGNDSTTSMVGQTIEYVRERANNLRNCLMSTEKTTWVEGALERTNKLLISLRDKKLPTLTSAVQA